MDTALVRSPVYQQLNARLRDSLGREYPLGSRFLTEREIAEKFSVSRPTANKALASLVSEGLLEFRKGVGTFVRANVMDYDLQSLVSFTHKARAAGKKPSTRVLEFATFPVGDAPTDVVAALQVAADEALHYLVRLRLADGLPVILEERYIVARHCHRLTKKQVEGSLYQLWHETFGLHVSGADEIIHAITLKKVAAQRLGVAVGAPAFEVTALGRLDNRAPLWWERTVYRGDCYEFRSHLGPIQSATPPMGGLRF